MKMQSSLHWKSQRKRKRKEKKKDIVIVFVFFNWFSGSQIGNQRYHSSFVFFFNNFVTYQLEFPASEIQNSSFCFIPKERKLEGGCCWFPYLDMSQALGRLEGWLYLIRFNRLGLQYLRKRYLILEENRLRGFRSMPVSEEEVFFLFIITFFVFIILILLGGSCCCWCNGLGLDWTSSMNHFAERDSPPLFWFSFLFDVCFLQ